MGKKKRVNLRLEENEIAVIGSQERWEHLIMVYEAFANDPDYPDKEAWLASAAWIREWIELANSNKNKDTDMEEAW